MLSTQSIDAINHSAVIAATRRGFIVSLEASARWKPVRVPACRMMLHRHGTQVFELGNKAELLVAVWKRDGKEGRTTVELTTDLPSDVVLHWGVKRGPKSDWLAAPKEIVPDHSSVPEVRWYRLGSMRQNLHM